MKILALNCGSSSVKHKLFDMETEEVLAEGFIEKIGEEDSTLNHKTKDDNIIKKYPVPDHKEGIRIIVELLLDPDVGVIKDKSEVQGVGHRVVHGGEKLKSATVLDSEAINIIKEMIPLAPLHNPANLKGIEVASAVFAGATHVGIFDTAFHQTMPPAAYRYAVPEHLYANDHIRKYGFHGVSHYYAAKKAAAYLKKPLDSLNLITTHIGNGSSITAIERGKSVDTSMGMTPLEGLMMGTRCGDIDPAVAYFLSANKDMDAEAVHNMLNQQSGLKGITGDNDLRAVEKRFLEEGDQKAGLGIEMCAYRIKKYIGAYMAVLGKVDALTFTAGIGENSHMMRAASCRGLENMGVEIDPDKNTAANKRIREISADNSKIKVLVIPANEELEIAKQTLTAIRNKIGGEP